MKPLLAFLCMATLQCFAQYPLNDPRNPDCPCHAHQRIAEEEYQKLLAQGVPKGGAAVNTGTRFKAAPEGRHAEAEKRAGITGRKKNAFFRKIRSRVRKQADRFNGSVSAQRKVARCFHWQ